MIDLLLEKQFNIKSTYWISDNSMSTIIEARGEYLGQQVAFRKELLIYDIQAAKFDILKVTEDDLKAKVIKTIREKLDNNLLNVL